MVPGVVFSPKEKDYSLLPCSVCNICVMTSCHDAAKLRLSFNKSAFFWGVRCCTGAHKKNATRRPHALPTAHHRAERTSAGLFPMPALVFVGGVVCALQLTPPPSKKGPMCARIPQPSVSRRSRLCFTGSLLEVDFSIRSQLVCTTHRNHTNNRDPPPLPDKHTHKRRARFCRACERVCHYILLTFSPTHRISMGDDTSFPLG